MAQGEKGTLILFHRPTDPQQLLHGHSLIICRWISKEAFGRSWAAGVESYHVVLATGSPR